jgi:hypothetical protein
LGINYLKDRAGEWISKKYLKGKHPDFFKSFFELTFDQGLNHECHSVTTEDGYILGLFRIRNPNTKEGAPVVFMQHGLLGSAENFIMNGEKSPAF